MTGLVTGESVEPTGPVGLANLEVLAWPTRAVGLADPSVPAWENIKFQASSILEYEIYVHQHQSQMPVELTCWPSNPHALEYAEFRIRQNNQ